MASISTVSFTANFEMEASTPTLTLTDTTDYAGQGIILGDGPAGIITLVGPAGTVYNNTDFGDADIPLPLSAPNSTKTIPLPLSSEELLQGQYTITYTVKLVTGDGSEAFDTTVKTINYSKPTADVVMSVDLSTPLLTSDDQTSYTVDLITPTVTRTHNIYYPDSLSISPITGTAKIVTTSVIYTVADTVLPYTSQLVASPTYDYGDGITLTDEVTGSGQLNIEAGADICSVYCCLNKAFDRYLTLSKTDTIKARNAQAQLEEATSIAFLIFAANRCGETADIAEYTAQLRDILDCTDDCDCGDEPQLVVGSSSESSITIVSAGTGISVSSVTGGSTTTYTVSIDSATLASIATNTTNIATNTTAIVTNAGNISTNTTDIATNATDIGTNTTDIATNATAISTNAGNISTNTTDIGTNTTDIATNATAISTNAGNISTNTTNIGTNTTDIATNAADIATNTADIATNTADIATNAGNISTNTTNISTNTSDISDLQVETWTTVSTFTSGWDDNHNSAVQDLQFRVDPWGMVHIQGGVRNSGTPASDTVFVLPSGYRPALTQYVTGYEVTTDAALGIRIDNTGNVTVVSTVPADAEFNLAISFIQA